MTLIYWKTKHDVYKTIVNGNTAVVVNHDKSLWVELDPVFLYSRKKKQCCSMYYWIFKYE